MKKILMLIILCGLSVNTFSEPNSGAVLADGENLGASDTCQKINHNELDQDIADGESLLPPQPKSKGN